MKNQVIIWEPHPGPQMNFLRAGETEVLYGGAAGGGKSDALLFGGLRHINDPNYKAVFIRRTYPELTEMIDRSYIFRELGGTWNETKKRWSFPSGATYEFGYFERWEHRGNFQGHQYQYIAWDELGLVPEERFWTFLRSRLRAPRSPDITPQMVASANPGGAGHAWVKRRWVDKCGISGDLVYVDPDTGLTRRFIPARIEDNPTLLKNDPQYVKLLDSLPDIMRRQLRLGDWGAAAGLALGELEEVTHIIGPDHDLYAIQPFARFFGAFDWGFMHPASFGVFMALPGGTIVMLDSLSLWRKTPIELAERISDKLWDLGTEAGLDGPLELEVIHASRDCFNKHKARGEIEAPTIADHFSDLGLVLHMANQARVFGLTNVRHYITTIGPNGTRIEPKFLMRDTVGNRQVFGVMESMVVDPKDQEDALKRDADDYGEGGDDPYDMVRYGLAAYPLISKRPRKKVQKSRDFDHAGEEILKNHPSQIKGRKHMGRW